MQIQYRDIPACIQISKTPPYTARELEVLFTESVIHVLLYHCPVCHATIMNRLKELRPDTDYGSIDWRPWSPCSDDACNEHGW